MSQRSTPFIEGEYYHIYSRGNSKQNIFLDDHDRDRFLKLLYLCNSSFRVDFREDIVRNKIEAWEFERGERIVSIGVWVLMPNHFHIYITIPHILRKPGLRGNGVTEFMHKLLTSYSKYFNKKYARTGGLFEGRFQAVHVISDPQAKYNFSYMHLNPVKFIESNWKEEGIKDWKKVRVFLDTYKWSSYHDHRKIVRPENKILNLEDFPSYFNDIKNFDAEINDWLTYYKEL